MTIFSAGCAARMNTFSLSAFIASIPAIYLIPGIAGEIMYGRFHPFSGQYRFCGTGSLPNVEAATLSVSAILLCWLCWQMRGMVRVWSVIATLIVGVFLVLTGSRISLIAVLVVLAFSLLVILLRDYKRLAPVLVASLSLIIAIGALLNLAISTDSAKSLLASALHRDGDETNLSALNGRAGLLNEPMHGSDSSTDCSCAMNISSPPTKPSSIEPAHQVAILATKLGRSGRVMAK
jgi:O-antigen ligase